MTQAMLPCLPQSDDDSACLLHTYAIVDCAHLDGLFYLEIQKDPNIVSRSLLADTPHEKSAIAGPLLILVVPHNTGLAQMLLPIEAENPAVVWLWSALPFDEIHPRLQMLQFGERRNGQKFFLRYFDPRNLEAMLPIFLADKEGRLALSLIQGWAYRRDGQYRYLT
ncbi:MAG: DUF4123 domain-containing protein [Azoarcus sp.]|jgi:hypothetical protein|nr:DUF4123 domain-containing protein [Azoarcus sp.]